ncbi:hypothetical protein FRC10_010413 [Ceratobasidium sp. 414]|nr:hypothetical protein FRC10_010413 [Ceratobasidium sp. 414]
MPSINTSALATLRDALSAAATINLPGDATFSTKRWALNAEKPAAIVVCPAVPEDVVQILAFVQGKGAYSAQEKLDFAVKGGGHNPSGASSSDGGLVIDLQPNMHGVRVDPDAKLAYVKGGSIWAEVDEASIKHGTVFPDLFLLDDAHAGGRLKGLASVAGAVNHTGVGGSVHLSLGGGVGWLCGQHGLVVDNVVQATVVTASGDILTASENENQDLHWAIRGGGGNFGVVTEFVYRLHDQRPDLYTATFIFPPPLLEAVTNELNAWMTERTNLETSLAGFVVGPGDQPVMLVKMVYNGDSEEGAKKYERFVKLGPVMHASETIPYVKLNSLMNDKVKPGESRLFRGNFIPVVPSGIPPSFVTKMFASYVELVTKNPTTKESFQVFELFHPDKWASVPSNATAYVHRDPVYNVVCLMQWADPAFTDKAADVIQALDQSFTDLRNEHFAPGRVQQGGNTNYLDQESQMESKVVGHRRFGSNLPRLVEVKRKYDPDNLFGKVFTHLTTEYVRATYE